MRNWLILTPDCARICISKLGFEKFFNAFPMSCLMDVYILIEISQLEVFMEAGRQRVPRKFLRTVYKLEMRELVKDVRLLTIDNPETLQKEVLKRTNYMVRRSISKTFRLSMDNYAGRWVGVKDLKAIYSQLDEKKIRSAINRAKKEYMGQGLVLANYPRLGYRLGVAEDVPIETVKGLIRAISAMVNCRKTLSTIKPEELSDLASQLLIMADDCTKNTLPSLKAVEKMCARNPYYMSVKKQLAEIVGYLSYVENNIDEASAAAILEEE